MVTGSKKPQASATTTKAAVKPRATAKAKTAAPKAAAKPKKATAKAPVAKATKSKAAAKPKATGKAKTTRAVKALITARKVGEMIYNDELLESMAELVMRNGASDLTAVLPEIKAQLFDYDIYMVSFLNDGEIGEIGSKLAGPGKVDAKDLTARLLTIRDTARVFVGIAGKHNSVRAYIDSAIQADGKEAGISRIKEAFLAGEYCLSDVDSATCESFLVLF